MTEQLSRSPEEFYKVMRPTMVRWATLLLGSQAGAEDIVQDAFAELYPKWDDVQNREAYLRRSVTNRVRSASRHESLRSRVAALLSPSVSPGPEGREVWDVVKRLPAAQRTALLLRYHQDLPVAAVADAMQCPVGTASSLLSRGLATLRREWPE